MGWLVAGGMPRVGVRDRSLLKHREVQLLL